MNNGELEFIKNNILLGLEIINREKAQFSNNYSLQLNINESIYKYLLNKIEEDIEDNNNIAIMD